MPIRKAEYLLQTCCAGFLCVILGFVFRDADEIPKSAKFAEG